MAGAKRVVITGGAGYVGSHTAHHLRTLGYEILIIDDGSTGHTDLPPADAEQQTLDILDTDSLAAALKTFRTDAIVHCAAKSLVAESVSDPALYYHFNVGGTASLCRAARTAGVQSVVFSSSAAVYGDQGVDRLTEAHPATPINPYGHSKLMAEQVLASCEAAWGLRWAAVRYFNACGAHRDALAGERHDPETHLIPIVMQTLLGTRDSLKIYGDDYDTRDGTCIRDYIDVSDLAEAHRLCVDKALDDSLESGPYNLGTEHGVSVREVVELAQQVTGQTIRYDVEGRRPGDPKSLIASAEKANHVLGWTAKTPLKESLEAAWRWHRQEHARTA